MRVVVQHPALTTVTIEALAAEIGSSPTANRPGVAVWHAQRLDRAVQLADRYGVDLAVVPTAARLGDFKLLACDMDSTLITIECIDEIADHAGRRSAVAAITAAAMRGEIVDYDESLRQRVALLAGVEEAALERVYRDRLRLSAGAGRLLAAARRQGLKTLLVSGGFTFFTDRLRERLGFDFSRSNRLEIRGGCLTGQLIGPIVNAQAKAAALHEACASLGCATDAAIAIGDGANDLAMMAAAGVSIAFRAKPVVRERCTWAINHGGLDAVLELLPE